MDLYNTVCTGNLNKLKSLIEQGRNVNWRDNDYWNLLHFACYYNKIDMVEHLVDYIDVNSLTAGGSTPMMLTKNIYIIKILLNKGANVNINTHATVLFYAVSSNNYDIARLLLANGADPNLANIEGDTPLHIVLDTEMLTVDVNMINFNMVELLLNYNADINLANKDGIKPIDKYPDIINYLPDDIKEPDN